MQHHFNTRILSVAITLHWCFQFPSLSPNLPLWKAHCSSTVALVFPSNPDCTSLYSVASFLLQTCSSALSFYCHWAFEILLGCLFISHVWERSFWVYTFTDFTQHDTVQIYVAEYCMTYLFIQASRFPCTIVSLSSYLLLNIWVDSKFWLLQIVLQWHRSVHSALYFWIFVVYFQEWN